MPGQLQRLVTMCTLHLQSISTLCLNSMLLFPYQTTTSSMSIKKNNHVFQTDNPQSPPHLTSRYRSLPFNLPVHPSLLFSSKIAKTNHEISPQSQLLHQLTVPLTLNSRFLFLAYCEPTRRNIRQRLTLCNPSLTT